MAAVEKAIVAHDDYEGTECEGNNSKVDEGALVGLMKHVLGMQGISSALLERRAGGPRLPAASGEA